MQDFSLITELHHGQILKQEPRNNVVPFNEKYRFFENSM